METQGLITQRFDMMALRPSESHGLKSDFYLKRCAFGSGSNRVKADDWLSNGKYRKFCEHIDSSLVPPSPHPGSLQAGWSRTTNSYDGTK